LFTTVPNAGTTAHEPTADFDEAFGAAVGKEGLGDVDVAADGKDLYAVNLHDRRLYRYDATQSSAAAPKASYAIPDPGCADKSDWRPFGLGIQDGVVYVGGVCSAQSTGSKDDLRAVVQTFDPVTGQFTGTVLDQPLNFSRGVGYDRAGCKGEGWYPWTDTWPLTRDGQDCTTSSDPHHVVNPEPVLSDIVFETNGDMVIGFDDRFANRMGWQLPATSTSPPINAVQSGDINRACRGGDHMFVLDANGGCYNNATAANSGGQNSDVKEFYPGDWSYGLAPDPAHLEISEGGLALSKVETTIPFTAMDPTNAIGSGVRWIDRGTGQRSPGDDGNYLNDAFGKTGGMADLEVLCDEASLQLGNRVWRDTDEDGIQDPGEQPVVGATVNLYNAEGQKIGTALTNERGEYYFDSTLVKNVEPGVLQYGMTYTIRMDNPRDYTNGGVLEGWKSTRPNVGDNEEIDSSGEPGGNTFPEIEVTPKEAGANDHSADFGFTKSSVDLAVRKKGPAFVGPGGEVHYNILVVNNGPNDSSGWSITDPLPSSLTHARTASNGDVHCDITDNTLTCMGGQLKAGESRLITVIGQAPMTDGTRLTNCVTIQGNETDPNPDNNQDCWIVDVPLVDPAVGSAAMLVALGGVLYLRRRTVKPIGAALK